MDQAREAFLGQGTRNNSIEVALAPDLPRVMGDSQRIFQVLMYLFTNASEHSAESSTTRRRAQRRIVELVRGLAPIHQLHLSYSTGRDDALAVRDELADLVEPERLIESRFGPVLGTHLGPNTIGVAATQGRLA